MNILFAHPVLVGTLALSAAAPLAAAQAQPSPPAVQATAGSTINLRMSDAQPKWPELRAAGATKLAVKWTCAQAKNPKITVSPEMFVKDDVALADKEQLATRSLISKAVKVTDFCAEHQLQIDNLGPGRLAIIK
jgi:hypothetical protein